MTVIWGLDLHDIQWNKFKSSYMWNNVYHLRRTKFIVYQCAMICCVVSESLGTAALSDYVDQQDFVERYDGRARVHNNDFVGAASYNIFVGVFVATIFGAGFFFDLFWPERHESRSVRLAWKICAVLASIMALSTALTITIIVATSEAYFTGVDAAAATRDLKLAHGPPLNYRHNGRAIAAVVFIWPGFIATCASAYLLFASHKHDELFGPKSTLHRNDVIGKDVESESPTTEMAGVGSFRGQREAPVDGQNGVYNGV